MTPTGPTAHVDNAEHINVTRLDNGLRVVTENLPHARSIAIGCWVSVGNRDEPPLRAGVSHFLEHLAFKGTARRSAREIAEAVDATGGEMNAFTTKEYTAYELRLPAVHLPFAIDVLCDVVLDPALRPADVESERQVILEELHLANDEPDDVVHTELFDALFPDHPLGWEIVGTEDTIDAMTSDAIRAFHHQWYRPSNLVFAAAGPLDHDTLVRELVSRIDDSDAGELPRRVPPGDATTLRRSLRRPVESTHVALGWRSVSHHDPDRFALAVANQLIGVGLSSRLFQEIRETRGLAYSVFSSVAAFSDTGVFNVYAGTTPAKVQELLEVVDAEIADIAENGPTAHEVAVAKGAFTGAMLIGLEDTGSRMARLATSLVLRDRVIPLDEFMASVDSVTVDDVQRVAQRIFGAAPTVATVGPKG